MAQAEAQALLGSLAQHFADIHTLSYTAERTTQGRRQSSRERWLFAYQSPGFVRVDYQYPTERHLILTTNSLTEYIPSLRRALQTDLALMSASVRQSTIKQTLAHISLDGINPSNFQEMVKRTVSVINPAQEPDRVLISGANPRFTIEVNPIQKVLRTTDIYTSDNDFLLHSEASKFTEASPGFWYPQQLNTRYLTEQGFVNTFTVISDIKINSPPPPTLFQFTPPGHVTLDKR
ncbi:MAG: hypothetical protein WCI95_01285 [bacterium]